MNTVSRYPCSPIDAAATRQWRSGWILSSTLADQEALGREPDRPAGYEKIESLPQRFEVLDADAAQLKACIAART